MRSIKFKGISIDPYASFGKWIFSRCIVQQKDGRVFFSDIADGHCQSDIFGEMAVEVDPSTVCQFTGLTDSEEREVYEGDMVHIENAWEYYDVEQLTACVRWGGDYPAFDLYEAKGEEWRLIGDEYNAMSAPIHIKVIGNIHEPAANPKP